MSEKTYDPADTALLVVDPYNDFMSEGGKLYDQIKDVADSVDMFGNLRKLIPAARSAGLKIFVLPHRSYREGDYENWRQRTGPQVMVMEKKVFERGTWGGEFHPEFGPKKGDVVVHEHWRRAALPTRTSTFNSSSTASGRSSWSAWSPIPASSPPDASGWNSAITSRWSRTPRPPSAGPRCKPLSKSTGRPSRIRS